MSETTHEPSTHHHQGTRTKVGTPLGVTEYKKTLLSSVATASMLPSPFEAIASPNSEVDGSDKRAPSWMYVAWARLQGGRAPRRVLWSLGGA